MKSINSLIKLHKKQIDQLAEKIGKVEEEKSSLENRKLILEAEVELEIKKCAAGSEYVYMLDRYLQTSKNRKDKIVAQIVRLDSQLLDLRNQLFEQFSEMKKFEIVRDKKLQEIKSKLLSQEVKDLDEYNVLKHFS